jgi:hypothetical protein
MEKLVEKCLLRKIEENLEVKTGSFVALTEYFDAAEKSWRKKRKNSKCRMHALLF